MKKLNQYIENQEIYQFNIEQYNSQINMIEKNANIIDELRNKIIEMLKDGNKQEVEKLSSKLKRRENFHNQQMITLVAILIGQEICLLKNLQLDDNQRYKFQYKTQSELQEEYETVIKYLNILNEKYNIPNFSEINFALVSKYKVTPLESQLVNTIEEIRALDEIFNQTSQTITQVYNKENDEIILKNREDLEKDKLQLIQKIKQEGKEENKDQLIDFIIEKYSIAVLNLNYYNNLIIEENKIKNI